MSTVRTTASPAGQPPLRGPSSHLPAATEPFEWLAAAFADAGPQREELRQELLRVWHPDRGHPASVAQLINAAANSKGILMTPRPSDHPILCPGCLTAVGYWTDPARLCPRCAAVAREAGE